MNSQGRTRRRSRTYSSSHSTIPETDSGLYGDKGSWDSRLENDPDQIERPISNKVSW